MAKGKDKKSDKGKKSPQNKNSPKGKKQDSSPAEQQEVKVEEPVINEPVIPPIVRTLKLIIGSLENVVRTLPISDVVIKAQYLNNDLGESPNVLVTDETTIPINHEFTMSCNVASPQDIDQLISNPVVFAVYEIPRSVDNEIYQQLQNVNKRTAEESNKLTAEEAVCLAEATIGSKIDKSSFVNDDINDQEGKAKEESKKKSKTKGKDKKGSSPASSKKGSKIKTVAPQAEITVETSAVEVPTEPQLLGTCCLDLIPLFLSNRSYMDESLTVQKSEKLYDDHMKPVKTLPSLSVTVAVAEGPLFADTQFCNIFNLTVESLYNLPNLLDDKMHYNMCAMLPSVTATKMRHDLLGPGKHYTKRDIEKVKFWAGVTNANPIVTSTKYRIDECTDDIKGDATLNIHNALEADVRRVEWNVIKRSFMEANGLDGFLSHIRKYKHIPLEIFIPIKSEEPEINKPSVGPSGDTASPKKKKGKDKGSKAKSEKSSAGSKKKVKEQVNEAPADKSSDPEFVHLMALVDASRLLYPGATRCRIACPVSVYHEQEMLKKGGCDNSYFRPKIPDIPQEPTKEKEKKGGKDKKGKKEGRGSKGNKSSMSKSTKSSKSKGSKGAKTEPIESGANDLQTMLPSAPPELLPSIPVYNEDGEPTFLVVEMEMLKPLVKPRELEDLSRELNKLIPPKPEYPKMVMSSQIAEQYYRETIKALTNDLNNQYCQFLTHKNNCNCEGDVQTSFISYLQKHGVYQTYLTSITKAASIIVNGKFCYCSKIAQNSKEFQIFVASVFAYLVSEMNSVLNEITTCGMEIAPITPLCNIDPLLLYAKEAYEIGADILAERYYLQRISHDERSTSNWFDYALFLYNTNNSEKAMECLKEVLSLNIDDRYSLLRFALQLAEKEQYSEAETCFLKLMIQYPRWTEGWGAMFLFYQQTANVEGADLCEEMAQKYLDDPQPVADYLISTDDLAWSAVSCPNTVFYRTAVLLLKMRAFVYAQKALACERLDKSGLCQFYLAVIMYYNGDYNQGLEHLQQARKLYGSNYTISGLTGHCYFKLGQFEKAKREYLHILQLYNRPEDIHMTYIYLAAIHEREEDFQSARKLLLLACKYSPTPYTWLSAGIMYFKQRDLLSAEECLSHANLCDNLLPEIWGYLTLVNVQLNRIHEAELCYRQALKNDLMDDKLVEHIEEAIKSKNTGMKI